MTPATLTVAPWSQKKSEAGQDKELDKRDVSTYIVSSEASKVSKALTLYEPSKPVFELD